VATYLEFKERSADTIMHMFNSAFHGDIRLDQAYLMIDEMAIFFDVIQPAIYDVIGLHIDYYVDFECDSEPEKILEKLETNRLISTEDKLNWRKNVLLQATPGKEGDNKERTLLTLRHSRDDELREDYQFLQCNLITQKFKLFKLNEQLVRSIWTGQQHELIYLKGSNPERGSIQFAPALLRNMVSSSSDLPLGYPVYISPVVTGFAEKGIFTNSSFSNIREWAKEKYSSWKQTSRELNPLNLIRAEQALSMNFNLTTLAGGAGNAKIGGDSSNDGISGETDAAMNVGLLRNEVPLLSGNGENDNVQVSNV
jgi:hypothetical protein